MADSVPKSVTISDAEFPEDVAVKICAEDGCDNPAAKRGRGYSAWCTEHIYLHKGEKPPKTKEITVTSRDKIAEKAESQIKAMLAVAQVGLVLKNDNYCAWAIGETGDDIAKSGGKVAADFKWMAKGIDKADRYFALLILTMNVGKLALMMGVHHDVIPYKGPVKVLVPRPPNNDKMDTVITNGFSNPEVSFT